MISYYALESQGIFGTFRQGNCAKQGSASEVTVCGLASNTPKRLGWQQGSLRMVPNEIDGLDRLRA
jgi:hypothetical protein